jgi:adenylate cyclase
VRVNLLRVGLGVALLAILLAHVTDRARVPLLDRVEAIIYDARLQATMARSVDTRIAILDIDERSLSERERGGEGRWPWARDRLAVLLEKLFTQYEVAVVGFDVVFSERDESSGIRVLEHLRDTRLKNVREFQDVVQQIKPQLEYDEIFAAHMRSRPVVLGYTFVDDHAEKGALPGPVLTSTALHARPARAVRFSGYTGNLPILQSNAAAAGHFNPLPDPDGVTRRVPLLAEYRGNYYEPLSLAVLRVLYGSPAVKPIQRDAAVGSGTIEALMVGSYRIPVDEDGAVLVPYRGPRESFAYHSVVDVLNDRTPISSLKGKIVLIGTTAPGMFDLRSTPVDPVYPGVEIHANLISGMLDGSIKQKPSYGRGIELLQVALMGAPLALLLPVLTPQRATLLSFGALLLAIALNVILFHHANLVLPLASVLATILGLYALNMAYGFFVEARGRRQITGLFGQYVPPELVAEMARDPARFSMAGESREMTVLFTDIRGFTTISEKLEPKVLAELMNEFLTVLTRVIHKHRGTIDKYMGDCIMAFWGAPMRDSSHAANAVLAALEMQRTIKEMQVAFRANGWPEINIGIGVNTGRMSVGNMGSRVRRAYTVVGDAVNLASRLEGITKEYDVAILVGEETMRSASDLVFREVDRVRVKGRDTAVTVFEPLGPTETLSSTQLADARVFNEAVELYRKQQWGLAEQRLLDLRTKSPGCRLYEVFLERTAFLRIHPPPPAWDGAFTFQSK